MNFPFELPTPSGASSAPIWTGNGFQLANHSVPVLSYDAGVSGWTDELTEVHEQDAGDDHYIDRASRLQALWQLQKWVRTPNPVIMDVGCSSGFLLKLLKKRLPNAFILGSDYVRTPLEKLAVSLPDTPLVQFNLLTCPLPSASFDALVLLNVLEHIEDDHAAAKQIYRLLRPGGVAVIEVPAGPYLYDIYDQQLMHYRRYKMKTLAALMEGAGFELLERSHLGFLVYPAFYLVKKRNQKLKNEDVAVKRAVVKQSMSQSKDSPLLHGVMKLEARMRQFCYLPTGIRCLVTCRRPVS